MTGFDLSAGGSAWVSALFDVLVACPAPSPVQFEVQFSLQGAWARTAPIGFVDLGNVAYSGCAASSP